MPPLPAGHPQPFHALYCVTTSPAPDKKARRRPCDGLAEYQKRIDDVKESIPVDRLLVFQVTDGWAPLCKFLNLPVPDIGFPRSNA